MHRIIAYLRFLVVYSAAVTAAFVATAIFAVSHSTLSPYWTAAAQAATPQNAEFDQITVHRINVVEPDGTPRLILADKAEFPGSLFHGREVHRPDRQDAAGFLFVNDEGTEDGGLLFGGYRASDGTFHSWGHLSFDQYEQDQAMALQMSQDGPEESTAYEINDNGAGLITPEAMDAIEKIRNMPKQTSEERVAAKNAMAAAIAKYQIGLVPRASLSRAQNKSVALRLLDSEGRLRILLQVAANGTPSMEFFDVNGNITHRWPDSPSR
jgi:hypothetical protein